MSSSFSEPTDMVVRHTIVGWPCVLNFARNIRRPPTTKTIQDKIATLYSSEDPNSILAAQILEKAMQEKLFPNAESKNFDLEMVMYLLGLGFIKNPVYSMVDYLIGRKPNESYYNDSAAEFIISCIPNFIEQIESTEGLRALAELYFKDHEDKLEILDVFDMSLEDPEFKNTLAHEINQLRYEIKVEHTVFLNIFRQARNQQPFSRIL